MTQTHYVCCCCSRVFITDKPQDPHRETGYGVCLRCRDRVARDITAFGFGGATYTLLQARARLQRFA